MRNSRVRRVILIESEKYFEFSWVNYMLSSFCLSNKFSYLDTRPKLDTAIYMKKVSAVAMPLSTLSRIELTTATLPTLVS